MKVYITGDIHGDLWRLDEKNFPEQKSLTKDDILIILGDFGVIWWNKDIIGERAAVLEEEKEKLDWLNDRPFTTCFIDGNHENHDRLDTEFPVTEFHGGKVHQIRSNVYHLMRGEIFDFDGYKFFCFGGAASHDIKDGVLRLENYNSLKDLYADYQYGSAKGLLYRIDKLSWWDREMPSRAEMDNGLKNLKKNDNKIDFVLTHSLPTSVLPLLGIKDGKDSLTTYFQDEVLPIIQPRNDHQIIWYSGHYHLDDWVVYQDDLNFQIKYYDIERIL